MRPKQEEMALDLGKTRVARDDNARQRSAFLETIPGQPNQITRLLQEVSAGEQEARSALLDQVYAQLRAIAQKFINHERPDHTLQATALVHEAYLRMLGGKEGSAEIEWHDRRHFYRAAAESMRRILIEHARKRGAEKRGGGRQRVLLNVCDLAAEDRSAEILALDDAIVRLEQADATAAEIVRLRFFAGLSIEQTAAAMDMSDRTIRREWTYARAKLFHLLEESADA
jgi:RNA polymerase sigma factor (TIGR02999 family)